VGFIEIIFVDRRDAKCTTNVIIEKIIGLLLIGNLVPRAFCFRSVQMALASAGHMTSKSPVFGVFNYDNLCV
jgi:hypothetical protein